MIVASVAAAVALAVGGLAVAVTGLLGFRERLPVNRFAGVLGGVLLLVLQTGGLVAVLVSLGGMFVIAAAGGLLGHKAALAVPEPEPELPAGCAGCACGNCGIAKLKRA